MSKIDYMSKIVFLRITKIDSGSKMSYMSKSIIFLKWIIISKIDSILCWALCHLGLCVVFYSLFGVSGERDSFLFRKLGGTLGEQNSVHLNGCPRRNNFIQRNTTFPVTPWFRRCPSLLCTTIQPEVNITSRQIHFLLKRT